MRKLIRRSATWDDALRSSIDRAVLADFAASSEFYRAWYVPLGFDPLPQSVASVTDAIAQLDGVTPR